MKKKIIVLAISFLLIATATTALAAENDKSTKPKGIISINPAGLLTGGISGAYEVPLDNSKSVKLGGTLIHYSSGVSSVTGFGGSAELRYYNENNAPEGFHFGPNGGLLTIEEITGITVGGSAGYQWIIEDNFAVDLYAGAQYFLGNVDTGTDYENLGFSGISPSFGVSLGYKF